MLTQSQSSNLSPSDQTHKLPLNPIHQALAEAQEPTQEKALKQLLVKAKAVSSEQASADGCDQQWQPSVIWPESPDMPLHEAPFAALSNCVNAISSLIANTVSKVQKLPTVGPKLEGTLTQFVKGVSMAMSDCQKDIVGILPRIEEAYDWECGLDHFEPVHSTTIRNFLRDGAQLLPNFTLNSDANGEQLTYPDSPCFPCALTSLAYPLLMGAMALVRQGKLDDGEALLEAVRNRFPFVRRCLIADGSQNILGKDASKTSEKYGALPNSCKGPNIECRKVHVLMNAESCGCEAFALTSGVGDERLAVKRWIDQEIITKGDMLSADAGYFSNELFEQLARVGAFFVIKGKQGLNPRVLSYYVYRTEQSCIPIGLAQSAGERSDWLKMTQLEHHEPQGTKLFKTIECGKHRCVDAVVSIPGVGYVRLIKLYNEYKDREGHDHAPYIYIYTNLPSSCFSPMDIWALSKGRWQVEEFYKALKSFCFMNGWSTNVVGKADFFILMALFICHVKILMGQQVQRAIDRPLSMLKCTAITQRLMQCYLGDTNGCYLEAIPADQYHNVSSRAKATITQIELYNQLSLKYGAAAWILRMLSKRYKSNVSRSNRVHLKSKGFVALMLNATAIAVDASEELPESFESPQTAAMAVESTGELSDPSKSPQTAAMAVESTGELSDPSESPQTAAMAVESTGELSAPSESPQTAAMTVESTGELSAPSESPQTEAMTVESTGELSAPSESPQTEAMTVESTGALSDPSESPQTAAMTVESTGALSDPSESPQTAAMTVEDSGELPDPSESPQTAAMTVESTGELSAPSESPQTVAMAVESIGELSDPSESPQIAAIATRAQLDAFACLVAIRPELGLTDFMLQLVRDAWRLLSRRQIGPEDLPLFNRLRCRYFAVEHYFGSD